ncbi:MAG: hypothetical protein QXU11_01865 [Thermoproteota archaeon]|nr:hypothetical protein [Candidatus Brockarchaeota archaeon]
MRVKRNHMIDKQGFPWLLSLAIILIVFAAATFQMFRTTSMVNNHKLQRLYQGGLTNRAFCPKCFSSTGLEPMGNHAFRCKNCGFIFSFGAP